MVGCVALHSAAATPWELVNVGKRVSHYVGRDSDTAVIVVLSAVGCEQRPLAGWLHWTKLP